MTKAQPGKEEPLGLIKIANGYMVTKGKSMYDTPYSDLFVFNTLKDVFEHYEKNFNEKMVTPKPKK